MRFKIANHLVKNVAKQSKFVDVCGNYLLLSNHFPNISILNFEELLSNDLSQYDYILIDNLLQNVSADKATNLLNEIVDKDILCMVKVHNSEIAVVEKMNLNLTICFKNDLFSYFVNYEYND